MIKIKSEAYYMYFMYALKCEIKIFLSSSTHAHSRFKVKALFPTLEIQRECII